MYIISVYSRLVQLVQIKRISWYAPSKDANARFTILPLKPLFDQNMEDIVVFIGFTLLFMFSSSRNVQNTFVENPQLK